MSIRPFKRLPKGPHKAPDPDVNEGLGWEEFDPDETAGPTYDEVQISYNAKGEQVVTVINNKYMVKGQGQQQVNSDENRRLILEARKKRSAELKEEALNRELRELNDQWGSW